MPIYRGPDGKIIEERTRKINDEDATRVHTSEGAQGAQGAQDAQTAQPSSADGVTKNAAAVVPPVPDRVQTPVVPQADADKTQLLGMGRVTAEQPTGAENATDAMADPTVGWLVVIDGPGKANVLRLGYGLNSIGRGEADRVRVDFGDQQISREQHAVVTYDPKGKKFYVTHGKGTNLTYLDEQPVLAPMELAERAIISIGVTQLLFVSLCGESFDWQDKKAGGQ